MYESRLLYVVYESRLLYVSYLLNFLFALTTPLTLEIFFFLADIITVGECVARSRPRGPSGILALPHNS